jgi:UDP-GlcNAc3NAcA epimerase
MKTVSIVGARPSFIKASLLSKKLEKLGEHILINTGQHYDINMADIFFEEFRMHADYDLRIGSGSQGAQTARMLESLERVLKKVTPDVVITYGSTNTTLAGVLAAAKLKIPSAHVESGVRSYNRRRSEEVNRVVADHISDILFAPTSYAMKILMSEGLGDRAHLVGDLQIELLRRHLDKLSGKYLEKYQVKPGGYILCTIHMEENVDIEENLRNILKGLTDSGKHILFPIHPRTRNRIRQFNLFREIGKNIQIVNPVGYIEMLSLIKYSERVCTDSSGVQKEAYLLKKPCVTLRKETEWIETIDTGWNTLAGTNPARITKMVSTFEPKNRWKNVYPIMNTSERICEILSSRIRV